MDRVKRGLNERKQEKLLRSIVHKETKLHEILERRSAAEAALNETAAEIARLGSLLLEKKELLRRRVAEASVFPLLALPDACVLRVLSFVGPRELGRIACTCKQLERTVARTPSLWERFALRPQLSPPPPPPQQQTSPPPLAIPGAIVPLQQQQQQQQCAWSCATPRELCKLEDCPFPKGAIRRVLLQSPSSSPQQQQQQQPIATPLATLKVCLCGASGAGKSALLRAFEARTPQAEGSVASTMGISFRALAFEDEGVAFALHVWDAPGEERFAAIVAPFYRGAKGVVLCYACDSRSSFERLAEYAALPEQFLPRTVAARPRLFVVGCRADRPRVVGCDEARVFARGIGATFLGETSAASTSATEQLRVEEAFFCVAHQIFRRCQQQRASIMVALPPLSSTQQVQL